MADRLAEIRATAHCYTGDVALILTALDAAEARAEAAEEERELLLQRMAADGPIWHARIEAAEKERDYYKGQRDSAMNNLRAAKTRLATLTAALQEGEKP